MKYLIAVFAIISTLSTVSVAKEFQNLTFVALAPKASYKNLSARQNCGLFGEPVNSNCEKDALKNHRWELNAYGQANTLARIGKIEIKIDPEDPSKMKAEDPVSRLRAFLTIGRDQKEISMDIYDVESKLFQVSVASVLGDWIQLSKAVSHTPVWINISKGWNLPTSRFLNSVSSDKIYIHPTYGTITVVKAGSKVVGFQKAEPPGCESVDESKAKKKTKTEERPLSEFVDREGRILLKPAFTRGC